MRRVFDSITEMAEYIRTHSDLVYKKTPYRVNYNGQDRFTFAGNSDQAIAAVVRSNGVEVESVPIVDLVN